MQKPRNLSVHESDACEHGESVGDTHTLPKKKPKDLSVHEREECEHGECRDVYARM